MSNDCIFTASISSLQSAELSGYAFEARSGDTLSFTSLRLGHIKIKVGGVYNLTLNYSLVAVYTRMDIGHHSCHKYCDQKLIHPLIPFTLYMILQTIETPERQCKTTQMYIVQLHVPHNSSLTHPSIFSVPLSPLPSPSSLSGGGGRLTVASELSVAVSQW